MKKNEDEKSNFLLRACIILIFKQQKTMHTFLNQTLTGISWEVGPGLDNNMVTR